jgi:hypothetical protein
VDTLFLLSMNFFPPLLLCTKNARIGVEILILNHSEVIFFMYIFQLIDQGRKSHIFPWVTFKCLSVQLCDPQDLMKNRKKPSEKTGVGSDIKKIMQAIRYK